MGKVILGSPDDKEEEVRIFSDGRPVLIEESTDPDYDTHTLSLLYSMVDIEDWTPEQHYQYLVDNQAIDPKVTGLKQVHLSIKEYVSGNNMFHAFVVLPK